MDRHTIMYEEGEEFVDCRGCGHLINLYEEPAYPIMKEDEQTIYHCEHCVGG